MGASLSPPSHSHLTAQRERQHSSSALNLVPGGGNCAARGGRFLGISNIEIRMDLILGGKLLPFLPSHERPRLVLRMNFTPSLLLAYPVSLAILSNLILSLPLRAGAGVLAYCMHERNIIALSLPPLSFLPPSQVGEVLRTGLV